MNDDDKIAIRFWLMKHSDMVLELIETAKYDDLERYRRWYEEAYVSTKELIDILKRL